MLIEIINYKEGDILNDRKVSALDNILRSHRERNHIVIISREQINYILKCQDLSFDARKTLDEIQDSLREYKSLVNELSVISKVDFSRENEILNSKHGAQDVIIVSYDFFIKSMMIQPTTLITENDIDHEMYEQITETYIKSKNELGSLKFSFQKNCGYGSHIYRVYSDYKSNKKFAFCVVDSDKKYPNARLGSTAGQFSTSDFKVSGTVEAKLLSVRELESLIPIDILEDLLKNGDYHSSSIDTLDKIKELNKSSNGEFRKFFDHKDGITLRDALTPKNITFWKGFFKNEKNIVIKDCFQSNMCGDCGSCIKINGFGDKVLEKSIEKIKNINKSKLFKHLPDDIKDEWGFIGKKAVSWGCAPAGRKARA
ncbi:hypothetical protein O1B54_003292 [Vibrio cholerae]|nr:hypothetical protein [Vibrio cholerae]AKB04092.1 hypothetical protein VAA049_2313 [Vibrio cholerae]EGR2420556.1 hypothetical protein [Vibrio cholerae]EKF9248610.1 hypothetical protein [Vibrio cholerae]MDV2372594.1 hypothetical protein [Vibrio cholerae]TYA68289.1 hypothetical protein FXE18_04880 [Vibrio cholerae]